MQDYFKSKRKQIDALIIAVQTQIHGSREVSIVITNLQESQMFLGLVLGALGAAHPYPQSTNHTDQTIEKRADQADFVLEFPKSVYDLGIKVEGIPLVDLAGQDDKRFQTGKIKFLRGFIQDLIDEIKLTASKEEGVYTNDAALSNINESIISLTKSKLWLGQQLNNIRLAQEKAEQEWDKFEQSRYWAAEQAYTKYVWKSENFDGIAKPAFSNLSEREQLAWKEATAQFVKQPA